jgi:hypothetical protein
MTLRMARSVRPEIVVFTLTAAHQKGRSVEMSLLIEMSDPPHLDNSGVRRGLLKGIRIKGGPK